MENQQEIQKDKINEISSQKIEEELECTICCNVLYQPISINCGHTFCKICLQKSLKIKSQCPLCRTPTFINNQALKENITLRNLIQSKYPDLIKEREIFENPEKEQKIEQDILKNFTQNLESEESISFDALFALELLDKNKFLFPGLKDKIQIKFPNSTELFMFICQDKKFVCIPNNKNKQYPYITSVVECLEIIKISNSYDTIEMKIKVLDRVKIDKISEQVNENEHLIEQFKLEKNFSFLVAQGKYFRDEPLDEETLKKVNNLVEPIAVFFQKQLTSLQAHAQNTFLQILSKIGVDSLQTNQIKDLNSLSKFSFSVCGSLKMNLEDKQRMFETSNIIERLAMANHIVNQFEIQQIMNPIAVFDIEAPGHSMNTLKNSFIMLIILTFVLYYIRTYNIKF